MNHEHQMRYTQVIVDGEEYVYDVENDTYEPVAQPIMPEQSVVRPYESDEVTADSESPVRNHRFARFVGKMALGAAGISVLYGATYVAVDAGTKVVTNRMDQINYDHLSGNLLNDIDNKTKFIIDKVTGK